MDKDWIGLIVWLGFAAYVLLIAVIMWVGFFYPEFKEKRKQRQQALRDLRDEAARGKSCAEETGHSRLEPGMFMLAYRVEGIEVNAYGRKRSYILRHLFFPKRCFRRLSYGPGAGKVRRRIRKDRKREG